MAGYKETPRQKMISMMYLVLTALLALNVSKEILDALQTADGGQASSRLTRANLLRLRPRPLAQRSPVASARAQDKSDERAINGEKAARMITLFISSHMA